MKYAHRYKLGNIHKWKKVKGDKRGITSMYNIQTLVDYNIM